MESVGWVEKCTELLARFFCLELETFSMYFQGRLEQRDYLLPSLWCKLDSVVWYGLVDIAVFWQALAEYRVSNAYRGTFDVLFPSD